MGTTKRSPSLVAQPKPTRAETKPWSRLSNAPTPSSVRSPLRSVWKCVWRHHQRVPRVERYPKRRSACEQRAPHIEDANSIALRRGTELPAECVRGRADLHPRFDGLWRLALDSARSTRSKLSIAGASTGAEVSSSGLNRARASVDATAATRVRERTRSARHLM